MRAKLLAVALMGACLLASGCSQDQTGQSNRVETKKQAEDEHLEKAKEQLDQVIIKMEDWNMAAHKRVLERFLSSDDLEKNPYRNVVNSDQKCERGVGFKVTTFGLGVDEDEKEDITVEDQSMGLMTIVGPDSYRGAVVTDYCNGSFVLEGEIDKSAIPELAGLRLVMREDLSKEDYVRTFDASNVSKWEPKVMKQVLKSHNFKDANKARKDVASPKK